MEPEASWPPPPPALPSSNEATADDVQHQPSRDMSYTPQFHDEEEDILGANTISVITAGSRASPLGSESSVSSTSSYRRRRASAAVAAAVDALHVHATQNEQSRGNSGAIQQPQHYAPGSPEQQPREPTHQHNSARSSPRGPHSRQRSISSLSEPPIQWGGSVTPVLDYHACTAQEDTCDARSRTASRISFVGHSDTPLSFQAPLHLEPQLRASLREGGGGGENPSPRASLSSGNGGMEGLSGVTGPTPFPNVVGRDAGHEHQRARSSFASQASRQSGHLVDDAVGRQSRASSFEAVEAPCEHYDLEMEEGLAGRGSASQCTSRRGSRGSVAGSVAEGEGINPRLSRPRSASARSSGGGAHEDAASHYSQGQYSRRTSSRISEGPRFLPQEGEAGYGLEVAPSPRSLGASRHSSHSMRDSAKAAQEGRWDAPPTAAGDVDPGQRSSRAPSYNHAASEADQPQHMDHQSRPLRHRQQAASRGSFSSALGPSMHSRAASLEAQGAGGSRARMDRSSHAIEMDHAPHPTERPSTLASKLWPSLHDYNPGGDPSHRGMEAAAPAVEPAQEEPQTPWPPHSRSVSRSVSRASSISARLPLGPTLEEALTPYPPPSQHTSRASSRSLRRSPTPEQLTRPMGVGRGRDQTGLREDRSAFSNATPPQPPRRASSSLSSSSDGSGYMPPSHGKQQHRGPPVAHGQGVRGSAGRSSFSSLLLHPNAHTAHSHVAHAQAASAIQLDIPVAHAKADIWQDDEIRAEAWETRRRSRETLTQEGGERGHHVHLSNSTAPQHTRAVGRRRVKADEGEGEGEKVLGLVREMYQEMDVLRQDMRHMGESSEAGLQALQSQGDERYAQLQGQLSECVAHLRDLRAHAPPQEHHHQHVHHAPLSPAAHAAPSPTHGHMPTYAHHPVHPPQPQSYQPPRHEEQAEVSPSNDHLRPQAPPAYSPPQHHQPASAFAFGNLPTAPAPAPIARNNSIPTVVDGAAGYGAAQRMSEGFHFAGGSDEATSPFGRGPGVPTGSWGTDGSFVPTGTGGQSFGGFVFGSPSPAPRPPRPAAQSGFFVPPSQSPQPQQHQHPLLQLSPDRQVLLVQFLDQLAQRRQRQQDKLLEAELLSLDVEDLSHRRSYSEARGLEGWGSRGLGQERWGEFGSRREGGGLEGLREEVGRVRGKCESNGEALAAARLELLQLEERMAAGERENMQRFESVRRALKLFSDTLRVDLPPHFLSTYSSYAPTTHSRYSSQRWHTSP